MATGATAVKFVIADFQGKWKFSPVSGCDLIHYQAMEDVTVSVVVEAPMGALMTYHYNVPQGGDVFVAWDVMHFPDRCVRQEEGNGIRCGG